ncbi:MAG: hypothetical protein ACRBN8_28910 [Nannocystales bacterium]
MSVLDVPTRHVEVVARLLNTGESSDLLREVQTLDFSAAGLPFYGIDGLFFLDDIADELSEASFPGLIRVLIGGHGDVEGSRVAPMIMEILGGLSFKTLDLSSTRTDRDGWRCIAQLPELADLQRLNLNWTAIEPGCLAMLLSAAPKVVSLSLRGSLPSQDHLDAVWQWAGMGRLESADFGRNRLAGLDLTAATSLRDLRIDGADLCVRDLTRLVRGLGLVALDASDNPLEAGPQLGSLAPTLETLRLRHAGLDTACVQALGRLDWQRIRTVDFSNHPQRTRERFGVMAANRVATEATSGWPLAQGKN